MKTIILDGIEYNLVPKENDSQLDYLTGHKNSGLKVRNKVRVIRRAKNRENGWYNGWAEEMNDYVGCTFEITEDNNDKGFELGNVWNFPYFVLEKVEEPIEPKIETYDEILDILKPEYYLSCEGNIDSTDYEADFSYANYITKERALSASARLKLEIVAHYLNEDKYEDVDWEGKYFYLYYKLDKITIDFSSISYLYGKIQFKSEKIAREAIQILGEEIIKTALK